MWLLVASLLVQQPGPPEDPRRLVRHVTERIEAADTAVPAAWRAAPAGNRRATLALATHARVSYRYPEARRHFLDLLGPSAAPPDRITLYARLGLAEAALATAPFDSVIAAFGEAGRLAAQLGDTAAWVEALLGSAYARSRLEGPAAAESELARAAVLVHPDSLALRSAVACVRATVLVQALAPEAKDEAERGLALARQAQDRRREGLCLRTLGSHYSYTGDLAPALEALDRAAALQRAIHDRVELASTLRWRGWFLLNWHDYPAAERDLAAAEAESRATGMTAALGWTLRHRAALAWRFGDLATALALIDSALVLLERQRDGWGVVSAKGLRGDVAMEAGRFGEAQAGFDAQVAFGKQAGRPIETYTGLLGLLHLTMRKGEWQVAAGRLDRLRRFVRRHRQVGWNHRLEYEAGVIALRLGRPRDARRHFQTFLATLSGTEHLAVYAAHSRLAESRLAEGDPDSAIRELAFASAKLDSLRTALDERGLRLLAFQGRRAYDDDAGFASIVAGLVLAGRVDRAFEFAEHRRARLLADRLLEAGLRRAAAPTTTDGLRAALPDSTALLFFLAGRAGQPTTAFLLQRDSLTAATMPDGDEVTEQARRFTTLLQGGSLATTPGHWLRRRLLDPLSGDLAPDVTRLVIVPDGELHRLPFDALPLADGRPLGSRFAVALAPSAALAVELWSRPRPTGAVTALAIGDPVFPAAGATDAQGARSRYEEAFARNGGLPRLPWSGREARAVRRFVPGAEVRVGAAASESWLRRASVGDYRLIHLATHAVVDEQRVDRTSLALAPGGGEDGFLGAEEAAALRLRADLVVLSACRTAGGVIVGGEGIQGLTAPLLEAGARAVVATMWRVSDGEAARFTGRFYRALADGEDAASALRAAKLASAASGVPAEEWAAFVLVGDPTVRLPLRAPPRVPVVPLIGVMAILGVAGYWATRRSRGRAASVPPS